MQKPTSSPSAQIEVSALSKTYGSGAGRARVLREVSLSIRAGEFISITGTSGSGKTSLLNIIGGLDQSYDGRVCVDDQALQALSDRRLSALRNRQFGFVFQQFNLLDHLSAAENIMLPSYFGDADAAAAGPNRARDLLDKVGLADKADQRPPALSGGQRQRVAIGRALLNRPDILLCDEPTGSLDRRTGAQIMALFDRLNRQDSVTLIVVTHEERIARMATRIVRLDDGRIVADRPNEPVAPDPAGIVDVDHPARRAREES